MIEGALIGAISAAIGALFGRFWPGRRRPKNPRPVCGCGHHLSYHEQGTGACHGTEEREVARDDYNIPLNYEHVQCGCQHYAGPQPLPEFYAPEITDGR